MRACLRAAYARCGARPARKDALTRESFEQQLAACDDSLIGLRDRALVLFGRANRGCRRSEIVHVSLRRRIPVSSHPFRNETIRPRPCLCAQALGGAGRSST